jgi:serine/threonine protein kinase
MDKFLVIPEQEQEIAKNNLGLDDFEILSTIGKGGYGFVAKVKSKRDHKIYAMKMIDFNKIKDQREITLSMNEIKLIQRLDSPHIIKYYHSFLVSNKLYIIMEFMSNKDLEGFIRAYMEIGKPIPYEEVLELFYQCAAGLCYCHKKNIIHRDIKPANLFMTDTKDVKIGDFGISAAKKIRGELNTLTIGTPKYMAPEMFKNTGYDSKIDVYALGCTFHILCYFSLPRDIKIFNFNGVQRGEIVDVNPTCFKNWNFYPQEIKDLIYQMIDRNPQVRLSSGIVFNKSKIFIIKIKDKIVLLLALIMDFILSRILLLI